MLTPEDYLRRRADFSRWRVKASPISCTPPDEPPAEDSAHAQDRAGKGSSSPVAPAGGPDVEREAELLDAMLTRAQGGAEREDCDQ